MLEVLQERLATGPIDTKIFFHGAQVSVFFKVRILKADAVGVVLQVKAGAFSTSEYSGARLHPWGSISFIELPA